MDSLPVIGSGTQRGVVLPLVLLLLVALTLVAHGSLYLARRELDVARASVRDLRIRLAAEGAIRGALGGWAGEVGAPLPVGGSISGGMLELDPGISGLVTIRRVGRELYLVQGEGLQAGWPGSALAARLVWVVEAGAAVGGFGAVVEVGHEIRLDPGSEIRVSTVADAPEGWEGVCEPLSDELQALYPDGTLREIEYLSVEPPEAGSAAGSLLGPLAVDDLVAFADRTPRGSVTPLAAVRFGDCVVDDPANWGSPAEPGGPCGGHLPLIVAPDSLVVQGGEGQGVLVVGGSLRLTGGARFWGLVLVAGDLTLEADTRIQGLVRTLGSVHLEGGGQVVGSGCPALRSLGRAPGLQSPVPLPVRSWISPY